MKIHYYALGDATTASSRLRVYKVANELLRRGHEVSVMQSGLLGPPSDCDVVIVQKRQDLRKQMATWMRDSYVVFDIDDPTDVIPTCHQLTVGSLELQRRHPGSRYMPDCLDVVDESKYRKFHHEELTRVCWFGLGCNAYHAKLVWEACFELGLQLVIITDLNTPGHDVPRWEGVEYIEWSADSVDQHIMNCDLVVCPYLNTGRWSPEWVAAKGENRLLKAWALGMPVAGAGIESYCDHGMRYFAQTTEHWVHVFGLLRSMSARQADAELGRATALKNSASIIAQKWLEVFDEGLLRRVG